MAIESLIAEAEKFSDEGKYDSALISVDKVLSENPNSFKAFSCKAQILLRSRKYEDGSKIIETATTLAFKSGNNDKISESLKLKSMIYFKWKKFDEAYKNIILTLKYQPENSEAVIFKNMVERKYMKTESLTENDLEVKRTEILKSFVEPKQEVEGVGTKEPSQPITSKTTTKPIAIIAPPLPSKQNMRSDWFDSSSTVDISIFIKRIVNDSVKINFQPDSIEATFEDKEGFKYEYTIDKLFSSIDVSRSTFKVFGTKLEITLFKEPALKWEDLNRSDLTDLDVKSTFPIDEKKDDSSKIYPSSSTKKIDWSKIDLDDEDDGKDEGSPDDFFKQLYANADPDAKRAMMKSYIESNGTTLSTDWKDVSNRKIEIAPPDGAEAKSWK